MADHNIYIHAVGTGVATNQNPTVPWSQRGQAGGAASQTQSSGGGDFDGNATNVARAITKAASYMQNPDSAVSSAVSTVAKAIPWVAAAVAVVKLVTSVVDTAIDFTVIESGDFAIQNKWQDFKQGVRNVLTPVSSTVNHFKMEQRWRIENQRMAQQRDLLGDSVINSYTRRGV